MKTTITNSSTTSLEVQQATTALNIENIKADISEIKVSIKEISGAFVAQKVFDEKITALEDEIAKLNKKNALWAWLSPMISVVVASGITFLLVQYLEHLK